MTKILCPVDLSESSRRAFDRALAVARMYGAPLTVLHVVAMPTSAVAAPFGPEGPGAFAPPRVDRERILAELVRFAASGAEGHVAIEHEVKEAASIHKEIVLQAQKLGADLLVLGTHGRSGFQRLLLGSVTEKVLRTSPVPVLTVPTGRSGEAAADRGTFREVLCAMDFSAESLVALRYAASLAEHASSRLTLLHVVETYQLGADPLVAVPMDLSAYNASLERAAGARLQQIVPQSTRLACDTEDLVVTGRPYVEILRVAHERQSDLIVLGVHGHNAIDRLVFGSTAEHIVRRAECPVLAVRADRQKDA